MLIAALLGVCAVGVGAYAAHGMEKSLAEQGVSSDDIEKRIDQTEVAVRYQMFHTLAILAIALTGRLDRSRLLWLTVVALLIGMGLFSGGLYSISLADTLGHWAIVPSGGLTLMIGWIFLAVYALFGKCVRPTADH